MAQELYTSCTACGAVFEITLEQLSLANGAVRCGVCGETFNARESLREAVTDLAPPPSEPASPDDTVPAPADVSAGASVDEQDAPPTPRPETDAFDLEALPSEDEEADSQLVALDLLDEGVDEAPLSASAEAPPDVADPDGLLGAGNARGAGLLSNLMWGTLGLLMLLLALAQGTVYWRDQLIQVAWLNAPLLALNDRLGTPIEFTYDVSRYRFVDRPRLLVETAPEAQAAQILQVQAELANDASVPQPLPHLRLILEDRWGRPVASRTLPPGEYLTQERDGTQFLQPEERIDAAARVTTAHAAPQAYTLDICLPAAGDRLDCGNSPTKR